MLDATIKRVFFGKYSSRRSRGNQDSFRLCVMYNTVLFCAPTNKHMRKRYKIDRTYKNHLWTQ